MVSVDYLMDREALQEYILVACQDEDGGLRDKPHKYDIIRSCFPSPRMYEEILLSVSLARTLSLPTFADS